MVTEPRDNWKSILGRERPRAQSHSVAWGQVLTLNSALSTLQRAGELAGPQEGPEVLTQSHPGAHPAQAPRSFPHAHLSSCPSHATMCTEGPACQPPAQLFPSPAMPSSLPGPNPAESSVLTANDRPAPTPP